jgi:hypothetical protein
MPFLHIYITFQNQKNKAAYCTLVLFQDIYVFKYFSMKIIFFCCLWFAICMIIKLWKFLLLFLMMPNLSSTIPHSDVKKFIQISVHSLYPQQTKFGGVYGNHPVRPSVRPSMYLVSATPIKLLIEFL